eukprot:TRINITY_DN19539_c0_g1_i3.p1 TRINITY_DN19539_c0_g1~~TRINITY_DN19539_c0_g1_i3.p1  ORF type:complete len:353 (+),score=56.44 TRINITY_DN19539_c0_g1_i3:356-1414(+)
MFAGGSGTLAQGLLSALWIRRKLQCQLPIEIWRLATERTPTRGMIEATAPLGIAHRVIPCGVSKRTTNKYTFKPLALLLSGFETVIFFDSDAIPVRDPAELASLPAASNASGIFWPDLWTLLRDAKIWSALPGGWPGGASQYYPAQESGVMVISKAAGGWSPLLLATMFNYYHQAYYPAVYDGRWHGSHGGGDKDTFQVAWLARGRRYRMMPPAGLVGPTLASVGRGGSGVCGCTIAQHAEAGKVAVLHHNANKWRYSDWQAGVLRHGLHLESLSVLRNPADANHADGMDDFGSASISSLGRSGIAWCVLYNKPTTVTSLSSHLGWDPGKEIAAFIEVTYSTLWMRDYMSKA